MHAAVSLLGGKQWKLFARCLTLLVLLDGRCSFWDCIIRDSLTVNITGHMINVSGHMTNISGHMINAGGHMINSNGSDHVININYEWRKLSILGS